MCTFFFSCKAILPVHENFILIAYAINIDNISFHDKDFFLIYSAWLYQARSDFWPKSPS